MITPKTCYFRISAGETISSFTAPSGEISLAEEESLKDMVDAIIKKDSTPWISIPSSSAEISIQSFLDVLEDVAALARLFPFYSYDEGMTLMDAAEDLHIALSSALKTCFFRISAGETIFSLTTPSGEISLADEDSLKDMVDAIIKKDSTPWISIPSSSEADPEFSIKSFLDALEDGAALAELFPSDSYDEDEVQLAVEDLHSEFSSALKKCA